MNRGQTLFISFLMLYFISTLILLIASTAKQPLPTLGGYVDVGLAVLIAICGFIIFGRNKSKPDFEPGQRAALYVLPVILLGMWYFQHLIDFNILLPGLAWRTFFFLHILPYGLNIWKQIE